MILDQYSEQTRQSLKENSNLNNKNGKLRYDDNDTSKNRFEETTGK